MVQPYRAIIAEQLKKEFSREILEKFSKMISRVHKILPERSSLMHVIECYEERVRTPRGRKAT